MSFKFKVNDIIWEPSGNTEPAYVKSICSGCSGPSHYHIVYLNTGLFVLMPQSTVEASFELWAAGPILRPVRLETENSCSHEWAEYKGFTKDYLFCKKCDIKQEEKL